MGKVFTEKNLYRCLLIVLVLLVYGNSLANQFVFDDQLLVVGNRFIKSWIQLPKVFLYNYWLEPPEASVKFGNNAYRPFVHVTLALDYALWGLRPVGFHLTNLVLMAILGLLLFELIIVFFQERFWAVIATSLYLVNPIHTEVVAFVMGRTDLLAGLLTVTALLFYWKWRQGGRGLFLALSLISWLLALISKEMAAALILIIAALELMYSRGEIRKIWRWEHLLFLLIFVLYALSRHLVLSLNSPWQGDTWDPGALATLAEKVGRYVILILWPFRLNTYYTDIFKPSIEGGIMSGFVLLLPLVLIGLAIRNRLWMKPAWAIQWLVLGTLPAMGIIRNTSGVEFGERFVFLSSFGVSLLLAWIFLFFSQASNRRAVKALMIALLFIYGSALGVKTARQNLVWRDNFTLFRQMSLTSPHCFLAHYNLGNEYVRRHQPDSAEAHYLKAIEIDSSSIDIYNNLGTLYFYQGDMTKAEKAFRHAVQLGPRTPIVFYNLGLSLYRQGRTQEAALWFMKALEKDPGFIPAKQALGIK